MSGECGCGLTFETFLTDPLIRLVMDSDGVSPAEMAAVLEAAGQAMERREQPHQARVLC
jgi:hypothetical protein